MKSRLSKFIISISAVTIIALAYVHQQVELMKLSYAIGNNERNLEDILERKEIIGYNIKELENPSRLEKVLLSKKIDIVFPKKTQIVKVVRIPTNVKVEGTSAKTIGLERKTNIFRIFESLGLSLEAQAKEK